MKHCAILLVIGTSSLFAAAPETETITAGPFRASVPQAFAKNAVVEKVAIAPLYSAEDWAAFKSDPAKELKPGYDNRPQHWAIRLPKAAPDWYKSDPKSANGNPTAPQILIHKADEWVAAMEDGKVRESATDAVALMRKDLQLWAKQPVERVSPAYLDASIRFESVKKKIQFQGGSGTRAVVQWNIEPELARRGSLHYLFLGLSDDGTCQIIATFPLDFPGLPDESSDATHLGYSTKNYEKLSKEFKTYEGAVKKWLTANAAKATPKLEELDAMMAGLVVKRWE